MHTVKVVRPPLIEASAQRVMVSSRLFVSLLSRYPERGALLGLLSTWRVVHTEGSTPRALLDSSLLGCRLPGSLLRH